MSEFSWRMQKGWPSTISVIYHESYFPCSLPKTHCQLPFHKIQNTIHMYTNKTKGQPGVRMGVAGNGNQHHQHWRGSSMNPVTSAGGQLIEGVISSSMSLDSQRLRICFETPPTCLQQSIMNLLEYYKYTITKGRSCTSGSFTLLIILNII